jgi:excisionase family DNA binding protein
MGLKIAVFGKNCMEWRLNRRFLSLRLLRLLRLDDRIGIETDDLRAGRQERQQMANILDERSEALTPTPEEAALAQESSRRLARFLSRGVTRKEFKLRIRTENEAGEEETVSIPVSAFRLLNDILTQMSQGNAVTIIPIHAELTTQQAADILNVSRPFLIEQLEKNVIRHRKVGTHRRIQFQDLMDYKKTMDRQRLETLEKLTQQAEDLDMGY